jgi:hypothetical protein
MSWLLNFIKSFGIHALIPVFLELLKDYVQSTTNQVDDTVYDAIILILQEIGLLEKPPPK